MNFYKICSIIGEPCYYEMLKSYDRKILCEAETSSYNRMDSTEAVTFMRIQKWDSLKLYYAKQKRLHIIGFTAQNQRLL